jgi:hypothetical protein
MRFSKPCPARLENGKLLGSAQTTSGREGPGETRAGAAVATGPAAGPSAPLASAATATLAPTAAATLAPATNAASHNIPLATRKLRPLTEAQ